MFFHRLMRGIADCLLGVLFLDMSINSTDLGQTGKMLLKNGLNQIIIKEIAKWENYEKQSYVLGESGR